MNGFVFLAVIVAAALGVLVGWVVRGQKDKPIYIPESMPHDSKKFPHHLHDHDKPKK